MQSFSESLITNTFMNVQYLIFVCLPPLDLGTHLTTLCLLVCVQLSLPYKTCDSSPLNLTPHY